MDSDIAQTVKKVHDSLFKEFRSRFRDLVLFGSSIDGSLNSESDIDLLVVLEGSVIPGSDMERCIHSTYSIQKEIARQLHFQIADYNDYTMGKWSFYRTILEEGWNV
jgi:predicted nucleotidyltransferase